MRSVSMDICTSVDPVSLSCFLDSTTEVACEKVAKSIRFPVYASAFVGHAHIA